MLGALAVLAAASLGVFNSGSDGSDGAFNPQFSVVIDLGNAATGTWDTPSAVAGNGVYDPTLWAVVFKYTTIDIPAKVTVTFINHPSGAPVVWLASGNVTISGSVKLDGANGGSSSMPFSYAEPGPGGFAGGVRLNASPSIPASAGFGPGGGGQTEDGTYWNSYGNVNILPLVGGSGGGGGYPPQTGTGGGAGGGAILVASSGSITLNASGTMTADGGAGGGWTGSGGAHSTDRQFGTRTGTVTRTLG
jgi:hypothetical protein